MTTILRRSSLGLLLALLLPLGATATNIHVIPALVNAFIGAMAPSYTVPPGIGPGDAVVGDVITGTNANWTSVPKPRVVAYRWMRGTANDERTMSAIPGANLATYTTTSADARMWIIRIETAYNDRGGKAEGASNAVFVKPKPGAPENTSRPQLSPIPLFVGALVTCDKGNWTGNATLTYAYQWMRNGAAIAGATGATYTLTPSDADQAIFCRVTASNAIGTAFSSSEERIARFPLKSLRFTAQPSGAVAGEPFTKQPAVEVLDVNGKRAAWYAGPVKIAIKPGTGASGAQLDGTQAVDAVEGVATFANLSIYKVGAGYVLSTSTGSLPPVEAAPLEVVAGPPAQMAFKTYPSGAFVGEAFMSQPVVEIQDRRSNLVASYTGTVRMVLDPGSGTRGAKLSGRTSVNAVGGIATFSDLAIDKIGSNYLLGAMSGSLEPVVAPPVTVTVPGPTRLVFLTQPGGAVAGEPFTTQPVVEIQDARGKRATTFNGPVTIGIKPGTGSGNADLSGELTVRAVGGIAKFELLISRAGTGYILAASSAGLTSAEADPLSVAQGKPTRIVFLIQPAGAAEGAPFTTQPVVELRDEHDVRTSSYDGEVHIGLVPNTGTGGAKLSSTLPSLSQNGLVAYAARSVNGVATFSGLSIDKAGAGYTLIAFLKGTWTNAQSDPFTVAGPPLAIAPTKVLLGTRESKTFTASGGRAPYKYSLSANESGGTIDEASGVYTAGAKPGIDFVMVTDASGAKAYAGTQVTAPLGVEGTRKVGSVDAIDAVVGEEIAFKAVGGTGPYTFSPSQFQSGASLSGAKYRAGTTADVQDVIRVSDKDGADFRFTVFVRARISAGDQRIEAGSTAKVVSTGGREPVTPTLVSGPEGGAFTASGREASYATAASTKGVAVIRFTDARGDFADAKVTVTAPPPGRLVFRTQPGGAVAGEPLATQPVVEVQDAQGKRLTTFDGPVTIGFKPGTGASNDDLAGAREVRAVGGIARFELKILRKGTGRILVASADGFTSAEANPLTVPHGKPVRMVFVTQPAGAVEGVPFTTQPVLEIQDASGERASSINGTVTSGAFYGGGGKLSIGNAIKVKRFGSEFYAYEAVNGIVTFSGLSIDKAGPDYVIRAAFATPDYSVLLDAQSDPFTVAGPPLAIAPTKVLLGTREAKTFTASGGRAPYKYSLSANESGGTIDEASGVYTAGAKPGIDFVMVTDAFGAKAYAGTQVTAPLGVEGTRKVGSFDAIDAIVGELIEFKAVGGTGPYAFKLSASRSKGSLSGAKYRAGPTANMQDMIEVTDRNGAVYTFWVMVRSRIGASDQRIEAGSTAKVVSTGGREPVTPTLVSGPEGGAFTASGREASYATAASTKGVAVIRFTDARGDFADAKVTVTAPLSIAPAKLDLETRGTAKLGAAEGSPPFSFSLAENRSGGSIDPSTGEYRAGASEGVDVIRVTDARGSRADATVTVIKELAISPKRIDLATRQTITLTSSGGRAPYAYSITKNATGGSIDNEGNYTAGPKPGWDDIAVTDARGTRQSAAANVRRLEFKDADYVGTWEGHSNAWVLRKGAKISGYGQFMVIGPGSRLRARFIKNTEYTSLRDPDRAIRGDFDPVEYYQGLPGPSVVRVTDEDGRTGHLVLMDDGWKEDESSERNREEPPIEVHVTRNEIKPLERTIIYASGTEYPFSYSVARNTSGGSLGTSWGTGIEYTAGPREGVDIIRVEGTGKSTREVTVNVTLAPPPALAIAPTKVVLNTRGMQSFSASGGRAPYTFTLSANASGGSIDKASGAYTAGTKPGIDFVTVTDASGARAYANMQVTAPLGVEGTRKVGSVDAIDAVVGEEIAFKAVGGTGPYTFSPSQFQSGASLSGAKYRAGTTADVQDVIRVSDKDGAVFNFTVFVRARISAGDQNVAAGSTVKVVSTGGREPVTAKLVSGPEGGAFTASGREASYATSASTKGVAVIRFTDARGDHADAKVTVIPPPPGRLVFLTQPGGAVAGEPLATQPVVEVQDAQGKRLTTFNGTVTIGFKPGTGSGNADLSGELTVRAVGGIAKFELLVSRAGTGYILVASSAGLTPAEADPLTVAQGKPTRLAFLTQPAGAAEGAPFATQPVVELRDEHDARTPSYDGEVHIGLVSNTGTGGAKLSSTLPGFSQDGAVAYAARAVNGVATFSGLSIDKAGAGYTLIAFLKGTWTNAQSDPFTVAGTPLATKDIPAAAREDTTAVKALTVTTVEGNARVTTTNTNGVVSTTSVAPGEKFQTGGGDSGTVIRVEPDQVTRITGIFDMPIMGHFDMPIMGGSPNGSRPTVVRERETTEREIPSTPKSKVLERLTRELFQSYADQSRTGFLRLVSASFSGVNNIGQSLTYPTLDAALKSDFDQISTMTFEPHFRSVNEDAGTVEVQWNARIRPEAGAGAEFTIRGKEAELVWDVAREPVLLTSWRRESPFGLSSPITGTFPTDSSSPLLLASPPAGLTYITPTATYTRNTAIATNTPRSTGGAIVSYAIQPALPAGLTLNATTGAISGTPTVVSATTTYTVTGTNQGGSTTTTLTITVNDVPAACDYTDDVVVAAGQTLDLSHCNTVTFANGKGITVNGTLITRVGGRITCNAGFWSGITVNPGGTVNMNTLTLEVASMALTVAGGAVTSTNGTFQTNTDNIRVTSGTLSLTSGTLSGGAHGLDIAGGAVTLRNTSIATATTAGINLGGGSLTVDASAGSNRINNNSINLVLNGAALAISTVGGTNEFRNAFGSHGIDIRVAPAVSFSNLTVTGNQSNGINHDGANQVTLSNCTLNSNTTGNGFLLNANGALVATNTTFNSNAGSGVNVQGNGALTLTSCNMNGNTGSGLNMNGTGNASLTSTTGSSNGGNGFTNFGTGTFTGSAVTFNSNTGHGIHMQAGGAVNITAASGVSNISSNGQTGVTIADGVLTINNVNIRSNTSVGIQNNHGGGCASANVTSCYIGDNNAVAGAWAPANGCANDADNAPNDVNVTNASAVPL